MKKENKLYVFKIGVNVKEGSQTDSRNEVIKLLKIAPIKFMLRSNKESFAKEITQQEFTFEDPEEARIFALSILETGCIFFCELKEVEVK